MKKLKVQWDPQFDQELESAFWFDKDLAKIIEDKFGSIDAFKESKEYKDLEIEYYNCKTSI